MIMPGRGIIEQAALVKVSFCTSGNSMFSQSRVSWKYCKLLLLLYILVSFSFYLWIQKSRNVESVVRYQAEICCASETKINL